MGMIGLLKSNPRSLYLMPNDNNIESQKSPSRPVALISGGAVRIGKSIATELHRRGVDIVIHCNRSIDEAEQLAQQFNQLREHSALALQFELSSTDSAKHLIAESIAYFGRLDYLVNNASIFYPTPIFERDYEIALEQFCTINFEAPMRLIREASNYLAANSGTIVNLIDIYSNSGLFEHTAYVASKSALSEATKQLALELAPMIRVNGISPGAIMWPEPASTSSNDFPEHSKQKQTAIVANTALKRKGGPDDIAAAVTFLLMDASYITGVTIAVDGGRQLYI